MAKYKVSREELCITSKVRYPIWDGEEAVIASLLRSIEQLQSGYLDVYLIHWPSPNENHVKAYKALQDHAGASKLVRELGMSNYTVRDYETLLAAGVDVKPSVVQFEVNPYMYRKKTIDYFQAQGVKVQAYRSFLSGGKMDLNKDTPDVVQEVAKNYPNKTVSQLLLRWGVQKGFQVMPKSKTPARIAENYAVLDFEIKSEDMVKLEGLTSQSAMDMYKANYERCIVEDTPLAGTMGGKYEFDGDGLKPIGG